MRQVVVYVERLALGSIKQETIQIYNLLKRTYFPELTENQICNIRIESFQMEYRMCSGQAMRFVQLGAAVRGVLSCARHVNPAV